MCQTVPVTALCCLLPSGGPERRWPRVSASGCVPGPPPDTTCGGGRGALDGTWPPPGPPLPPPALPLLLFLFLLDPVSAFSCGVCNAFAVSPAAVDPSARTSMKNAASCDKWCELQESVSHRVFERKWRPRAPSRGYVCPSAPCQLWPVAGGGYAGGARVGCCVCLGFSPGVCE